ncbi:hypothetical protein FOMPIDRAFT_1023684 [Fomitopsis schrenkii]|uniref:SHSP domain-containing protein n=1 Tax=Fomitopsis schrenkii TaxID=2126942 RepID=S8FGI6_FOMSC|nr:hypothetical protein FOMPIDRAFT_1023684 [Fomitopsis schrenkii]
MARMQLSSDHNQERNFRVLDRILARTFVQLLRHRSRQPAAGPSTDRTLRPRMDLCDDPASSYIVATLELPGLKQEDLSVRIENEELVVQGERRFRSLAHSPSRSLAVSPNPDQNTASARNALVRTRSAEPATAEVVYPELPHGYTTQEIKYGMFERRVALPLGTQVGHVRASLVEGMLTLSWPRNPLAVPASWQEQDEPMRSTEWDGYDG